MNNSVSIVPTELVTIASEQLQDEIEQDLNAPDPQEESALAKLINEEKEKIARK